MKTQQNINYTDKALDLELQLFKCVMKENDLSNFLDSIVVETRQVYVDTDGLNVLFDRHTKTKIVILNVMPLVVEKVNFLVTFQVVGA